MAVRRRLVLLALALNAIQSEGLRSGTAASMNPIRRVVSTLQMMQTKVTDEGMRDKKLFEKFMCYCKTGAGDLGTSIAAAETKLPQLESSLGEVTAVKAQLGKDISIHKADRAEAKDALAKATALREKEAAAYAKESSEGKTNIAAMATAIAALEKGSASFLQSSAASVAQRLSIEMDMSSASRDLLSSFLSQGQGYAPKSGEIAGVLKQMKETMEKTLAETSDAEDQAKAMYDSLVAAKKQEIAANTRALESKLVRKGTSSVEVESLKEDLDDTSASLAADRKFLADIDGTCKTKKDEWEAVQKTRADELTTLGETIRILNEDDALQLFKKTLPSPSLLQTKITSAEVKQRALRTLRALGHAGSSKPDVRLNFIALALHGRKVSFDKVITMVNDMLALLAKEQAEDDDKRAYCEKELDKTEDEMKGLERSVADIAKAAEDATETIDTIAEEISALETGIKELDASVAEATEIRKADHKTYSDTLSANTAAKEIVKLASNRLNKFYNKGLYKQSPKKELSAEERIVANMGVESEGEAPSFVQRKAGRVEKTVPAPPPETFSAYAKKGQESAGVLTMLGMLAADLDKDMQEMEIEEKDAQADYEKAMEDASAKRAADAKSIEEKEGAKAELQEELERMTREKKSKTKKVLVATETMKDLHMECDWLIANFDARKEARAGEVESLKNAKAVLSGADYSLIQIGQMRVRQ